MCQVFVLEFIYINIEFWMKECSQDCFYQTSGNQRLWVIIQFLKMCFIVNPLNADNPLTSTLPNGKDLDKMTVATVFHRDLHCLLFFLIIIF